MIRTELNPAGNFKPWPAILLNELKEQPIKTALGQRLIFEDDGVRVWEIELYPGERLAFRKLALNYCWIALTSGLAITRCCDGSVDLYRFDKGVSKFLEFEGKNCAQDLENIGDEIMVLNFMEFKKESQKSKMYVAHTF